jgi:hypothetical protein
MNSLTKKSEGKRRRVMFTLAATLVDDMKLRLSPCTRLAAPLFALGLALVFALGMSMPAFADPPFELDGNAIANDFPGDDWNVVNTTGGDSIARTGLIVDRPEPAEAQFLGGGSKDIEDVPNWRWTVNNPQAKDDITNAYAAAYRFSQAGDPRDGHLILVFGLDRFDTSGNAQLGFWFLQGNVRPVADGAWSGTHQDNDILVLVNFTVGGTTPTISVYRWLAGAIQVVNAGGAVTCTGGFFPGNSNFCAITNTATATAPWTYFNKDIDGGDTPTNFPPGAFFEGGIDLTGLGLEECITQFLSESRSSQSINATLQDFAVPNEGFQTCNIEVTKTCAAPRLNEAQDAIIYDISGTVTANGGTVFDVTLSDDPAADGAFQRVDCADPSQVLGTFPLDSLNGVACYSNTITVPLTSNGLSDTITAEANTEPDGTGVVLTDDATAECPNLQINPQLQISKDCESVVEVVNNQVVVKVNVSGQVCNIGDTNLSNVTVTDDKAGPLLSVLLLTPGLCAPYSGEYFPSEVNSPLPSDLMFTDTATATATDIFGDPVPNPDENEPPVTDVATCPLCP